MIAQKCPVCEGNGKVSKYSCVAEKSGLTRCGTERESCHGCDGKGWVLVPEGDAGEDRVEMIEVVDLHKMVADCRPEYQAVFDALLDSCQFVRGPWVAQLEKEWKEYLGRERFECVAVTSGTTALELVLEDLRKTKRSGSVLVPSVTFWATVASIHRAGLTPILVDVDDRGLMDVGDALRKKRRDTIAVLHVDLYGAVPHTAELLRLADESSLVMLEDAAQAHGSERVGEFAEAVCFSHYPSKNMPALGEGGMIVAVPAIADRIRCVVDQGRVERDLWGAWGTNARMPSLTAGLLLVNLAHLPEWAKQRQQVYAWYKWELEDIGDWLWVYPFEDDEVPHLMIVRVPAEMRDDMVVCLNSHGIGARVHYSRAMHEHPAWAMEYPVPSLPRAEEWVRTCISLPVHPWLTFEDVRAVCDGLKVCYQVLRGD